MHKTRSLVLFVGFRKQKGLLCNLFVLVPEFLIHWWTMAMTEDCDGNVSAGYAQDLLE